MNASVKMVNQSSRCCLDARFPCLMVRNGSMRNAVCAQRMPLVLARIYFLYPAFSASSAEPKYTRVSGLSLAAALLLMS